MTARDLARNQAFGRLGVGVAMLVAPARVTVPWVGRASARRGPQVLTRALGAREVALGLGQVLAVRDGAAVRPWLLGGVVADGVDLVATVRGRDHLPALGVGSVSVIAAGSTLLGAYLARELS